MQLGVCGSAVSYPSGSGDSLAARQVYFHLNKSISGDNNFEQFCGEQIAILLLW